MFFCSALPAYAVKLIYIDTKINSKIVEELNIDVVRDTKFESFDIETAFDINNKYIPVTCGWKIKKIYKDYFISKYESTDSMFKHCFDDMLKQDNYTWYAHHLGGFDAVFILKQLFINYKTKVQFKDSKPISIIVSKTNNKTKNNKTIKIVFKDSYKILPLSLRALIKAFEITTQKLFFPYKFMTIDNLNYDGKLPDKSFYDNISDLDYQKLVGSLP